MEGTKQQRRRSQLSLSTSGNHKEKAAVPEAVEILSPRNSGENSTDGTKSSEKTTTSFSLKETKRKIVKSYSSYRSNRNLPLFGVVIEEPNKRTTQRNFSSTKLKLNLSLTSNATNEALSSPIKKDRKRNRERRKSKCENEESCDLKEEIKEQFINENNDNNFENIQNNNNNNNEDGNNILIEGKKSELPARNRPVLLREKLHHPKKSDILFYRRQDSVQLDHFVFSNSLFSERKDLLSRQHEMTSLI